MSEKMSEGGDGSIKTSEDSDRVSKSEELSASTSNGCFCCKITSHNTSEEGDKKSSKSDTASINTDVLIPVSCFCCKKASCKRLCCSYNSYCCLLILFVLVLSYQLVGGALFSAVEKPNEDRSIREAQVTRNNAVADLEMEVASFVDRMANLTNLMREELENSTRDIVSLAHRVSETNRIIPAEINPIWDYASAVFFTSTNCNEPTLNICVTTFLDQRIR